MTLEEVVKEMLSMKREITELRERVNTLEEELKHKDSLSTLKDKAGIPQKIEVETVGVSKDDLKMADLTCFASFHDSTPTENVYKNKVLATGKGKKKEIRCVSSDNLDRESKIQMLWIDNDSVLVCPNIIHYFEVQIEGNERYCYVSVGMSSTKSMVRNHHIGWDKYTIGLHSDDGNVFKEDGKVALPCTTPFGPGDVIGCGWNSMEKQVFFTRNGQFLKAFSYPHQVLNFGVGMKEYERLEINTGISEPFEFDLCGYIRDYLASRGEVIETTAPVEPRKERKCCDCGCEHHHHAH